MARTDAMKFYMRDIAQIPLVDQEEEVRLARRIHDGDVEAREKLIRANLRLVVKIAHDFRGMGLPLQDLVSEGNIGLMRAAEKFDPDKGAKFSSYAAWWIKQAMRRALSEKSRTIRVPIASGAKISKIRYARIRLTETLGRDPTDEEIAAQVDCSERVVNRLKQSDTRTVSLHDPIMRGEEGEIANLIPDENAESPFAIMDDREAVMRLRILMKDLDPRERTILLLRFGLDGGQPQTLEQISQQIGRTRERVRQIQQRALDKLRQRIHRESLADLLGLK